MHINENETRITNNKVHEWLNKQNYAFDTLKLLQKCMTVWEIITSDSWNPCQLTKKPM
jgi:hypothetical protein